MLFALILAASTAFTMNLVSVVAYTDEQDHKYYGLEPVNEKLKSVPLVKPEKKEEKTISFPKIVQSYQPVVIQPVQVSKPQPKRTPIKVIHDDWFMKHYDRICELEAISGRSVLDMYDHEAIFQRFSDLKMLARNLAWEQQQARQK